MDRVHQVPPASNPDSHPVDGGGEASLAGHIARGAFKQDDDLHIIPAGHPEHFRSLASPMMGWEVVAWETEGKPSTNT